MKLRDFIIQTSTDIGVMKNDLAEHMRRTEASERRADASERRADAIEEAVDTLKVEGLRVSEWAENEKKRRTSRKRFLSDVAKTVVGGLILSGLAKWLL